MAGLGKRDQRRGVDHPYLTHLLPPLQFPPRWTGTATRHTDLRRRGNPRAINRRSPRPGLARQDAARTILRRRPDEVLVRNRSDPCVMRTRLPPAFRQSFEP